MHKWLNERKIQMRTMAQRNSSNNQSKLCGDIIIANIQCICLNKTWCILCNLISSVETGKCYCTSNYTHIMMHSVLISMMKQLFNRNKYAIKKNKKSLKNLLNILTYRCWSKLHCSVKSKQNTDVLIVKQIFFRLTDPREASGSHSRETCQCFN